MKCRESEKTGSDEAGADNVKLNRYTIAMACKNAMVFSYFNSLV